MTLRVHPDEIVRDSTSGLLACHRSWERVRLGEVAEVLNGFAFKSGYFSKEEGTPLLRIRDVGKSSTDASYSGPFDPTYLVRAGELVVGMDGDFRTARWSGPDAVLNQRVCKITIKDESGYDPAFLSHVLQGYLDAIHTHTSAVTVKHLSSRTVQEIPLPLPPLNEQRRIVAAIEEHLSHLDAAEASLRRARKRIELFNEVALATALDGEWPHVRLSEIAVTTSGGTPSRRHSEYYGGPIPWVKSGELRDGRVVTTEESISELGLLESSAKVFPKGTLLIALYGATIGKLGILDIEAATNQAICAIKPHDPECVPFLRLALRSKRAELISAGQGGAQPNISQAILRRLTLPFPPPAEQRRVVAEIEERVSVVDAMRTAIERAQRRSASIRRSVLERTFRGELVPQDPSDEPASALLERIRLEREATPVKPRPRRVRA